MSQASIPGPALNLSAPDAVVRLHRSFLDAGSQVIETNTFGANGIVLAEYGLQDRVDEINRQAVAHARHAVGDTAEAFVAGSVGPSTRLPSLGQISYDEMYAAYADQLRALVVAGIDVLLVETCQDPGQIKIALAAAYDAMSENGIEVPVMLSVTVEASGALLVGTGLDAVIAAVEPFALFSLGLNCATGPELMGSHVEHLSRTWPGRVSVMPNAGLPRLVKGQLDYPLSPEDLEERGDGEEAPERIASALRASMIELARGDV